MSAVTEKVNWSAVASRAFEDKLAEVVSRKDRKNMSDVVERLRASKRRTEDKLYQQGHEDGVRFARDQAEAVELERLAKLVAGLDWEQFFWRASPLTPGDRLLWHMDSTKCENLDLTEIWEQIGGENGRDLSADKSYVRGFANGALLVWAEVKPLL